ncbi:ABC transporter permease [Streptomyces violaceorubidus]|uniref:Transport permease protein n=1 Tax=Streptomyces violaceorubidus TaxID=284042 RepID=A0ABV1T266_9ACTN|nr:ABC transporter permease [Streptomyces violaceorubidus]
MAIQEQRLEHPAETAGPPTGVGWRGAGAMTQLGILTARQIQSMYGDRRLALFSLVQPIIMLLLLSEVFGTMADPSDFPHGVRYIDYVVPALLVTTGIGSAQGAGVGLVRDMDNGMVARFRVLPTRLPLVLAARSLADLVRVTTELAVLLVVACVMLDFRPAGGVLGTAAALLLTLVVIWALIWGFIAFAAWLRSVELMSSIAVLVMFPLMFASSAFVPLNVLPEWLRMVARLNPITYAVDGSRKLALGWDPGWSVPGALATSAVLLVVAVCVAVRTFRRPPNE